MKKIFFFLLVLIQASFAKDITLNAAYMEFPPYQYQGADGKPAGILIDLANKAAKKSGYRFIWKKESVKRLFVEFEQGKIDYFPCGLHGLNKDAFISLGTKSILDIELRAYYLKGTKKINSKKDLLNQKLIVIKDFTYGGLAQELLSEKNKHFIQTVENQKQVFDILTNRTNYYKYGLLFKRGASKTIKDYDYKSIESSLVSKLSCYNMVSKKTKNFKKILKALDNNIN